MAVRSVLLAHVVLIILFSVGVSEDGPKYLTSLLKSNWGYTPFLLEASEFLWDFNENRFWNFVNLSKDMYVSAVSDQDVYESVTDLAEQQLPTSVHNLFLLSLSLHTYSPAVQVFRQLSTEALNRWSSTAEGTGGCSGQHVFMEVHGHFLCSISSVQKLLSGSVLDHVSSHVYKFDHLFSSSNVNLPLVILYGELGTPGFATFHSALMEMAIRKQIRYIFRHYYQDKAGRQSLLSGYGVQLSVKNTEYKAVDDTEVKGGSGEVVDSKETSEVSGFVFPTLRSRYPSMTLDLADFEAHLLQGARELPELRLWQLQDLGYQAVQRIAAAGAEFGLKVLKDISQNLPTQAKSLYKIQVDKALRKEIQSNQKALGAIGVSPGDCVLFLNGIVIQKDSMDIYQLFEVLFSESQLLDSLNSLGIDASAHSSLLAMPMHRSGSSQVVVDVRGKAVVFINDLEKDRQYRSWAKSLKEFLRPTYPGMLRQIARNVFNIVFMLDPWSISGVEMLEYVKLFLEHMVPARLGLVLLPNPNQEAAVAVTQGFAFLATKHSPREGLRWLVKAQELLVTSTDSNVTVNQVHNLFQQAFSKLFDGASLTDVFSEQWDSYRKEAEEFFSSKGFTSVPQVLVNGVQLDLEEDLESVLVTRMQYQTFEIQQALFNNKLKDKDIVYDYFMEKPQVLSRINVHVLASSPVFDLSHPDAESLDETANTLLISADVARRLNYISQPQGEFEIKELTVWMIVDLKTNQGRQMTLEALQYSVQTQLVRVGIVHNDGGSLFSRFIQAALSSYSPTSSSLISFLQGLLQLSDSPAVADVVNIAKESGLDGERLVQLLFGADINSTLAKHALFSSTVLRLKEGQNALLSNGKLVGPLSKSEVFTLADWSMLDHMESETYAAKLASVVGSLKIQDLLPDEDTSSYRSDLVMKLASLLRSQPKKNRLSQLPSLSGDQSVLHVSPLDPDLYLTMIAVLDPLSPDTQRFAPILQVLQTALSIDLTIYFNPVAKLSQMPISSFYRYVLQPELSFSINGSVQENVVAVFSDLPTSPLFTLSLDVPHSWLVEPVFSPYDLDNIHLAQIPVRNIHAEFILEHILVEGQCFDAHSEQPTPGLEFVLGSDAQPNLFDTIVMANLGYFQLKASPGAWVLRLREGKSRDIYFIKSSSGAGGKGGLQDLERSNEVSVSVRSYSGAGVVVKVAKKEGMESVELLGGEETRDAKSDESGDDGLWSALSNLLKSSSEEEEIRSVKTDVSTNETINIYSIASGHLYERFLRIMMLSVLKHTQNPVKFWFLKNYLSPTFKETIPDMASHYGFEYELVEYKWPRWLHQQTQKQRIIWGYKILFLDVLFPLNIMKIIFVDADQIVRTDLKELLEMPMDGAPYAYTPFCDSRPDMEGFRFWEKGYWKSHLGNRRYHISALYVVDLVAFRRLAAGDRLRGQYQALSQDPNSLSNLDQDLPNNMIHSVPIKSLPQEWLWCETWCSEESKAQAKTIDLCNNPLTKEPKLQSAMRIVPEWTEYDKEIKSLWSAPGENQQDNKIHSHSHDHTEL